MVRLTAVAIALTVAACSGSGPTPAPTAELIAVPEARETPVYPPSHLRGLSQPAMGDLDDMTSRAAIRVLVAESRTHYHEANRFRRGRTHDAAELLQQQLNERPGVKKLAVILIPTPEDQLIPDLLAGKGDVAANVLLTIARDEQVVFAPPVRSGIRELIVTGPKEAPLVSLEDVAGRSIHVRVTSDHHASLVRLNGQLQKINRPPAVIAAAPATETDEDLIEAVNDGRIPATVVDDYIFDKWKAFFPNVAVNRDVAVSQDGVIAWVTRKDTPKLTALLKEFFTTHVITF